MKFTDWETELKKHGYVVTDSSVTTKRGDVLAGKDPYGGYYVNDSKVQEIISKPISKVEIVKKVVRKYTKKKT